LGNCYYALGEYGNALGEFHHAADLKPDFFSAQFKAALCYYHLGSLTIARAELERLRDMQPENKHPYRWLGEVYGQIGFYEEMLSALEEYKRLAGEDFFHGFSTRDYDKIEGFIAKGYAMMGQYDTAFNYYRIVIDDYWGPYQYDIMLAMIYARKGESSKAESWQEKAIAHLERNLHYYSTIDSAIGVPILLRTKAYLWWLVGRYDRAIATADSVGTFVEFCDIDAYNRGVYRVAAGDVHGLDDLRHASEIVPYRYCAFYDAVMSVRVDSLTNALSILDRNKEYLAASGIGKALYAQILEKLGRVSEAQKWWFQCYGRIPFGTDVESMRHFMDDFIAKVKMKP